MLMTAGLLALRLQSSPYRRVGPKTYQSPLCKLVHQHATYPTIEQAGLTGVRSHQREEPSSSDLMGSRGTGPAMPRPYQYEYQRKIKWPPADGRKASTSIRMILSHSDMQQGDGYASLEDERKRDKGERGDLLS